MTSCKTCDGQCTTVTVPAPAIITCDQCTGDCCKYIAIEIDTPESREDFENIKWYLCHGNVTVYQDWEDSWLVEFKTNCKYLADDNRCKIYESRPQICRDHDMGNCVKNGEGEPEKVIFRSIEDVEKHIKEHDVPSAKA
jgi:Fe-S-cluster containining protein